MKTLQQFLLMALIVLTASSCKSSTSTIIEAKAYAPATGASSPEEVDWGPAIARMLQRAHQATAEGRPITLHFPKGTYHIYPDSLSEHELFISNHDHEPLRKIAFFLDSLSNVTIEGDSALFLFHGRQIPFVLNNCTNVKLTGLAIDYPKPALSQFTVTAIDSVNHVVTAEMLDETDYRIENNRIVIIGEGYEITPIVSMPFTADRHMVYGRADVSLDNSGIDDLGNHHIALHDWSEEPYATVGNRYILRTYYRPTPGIVIADSRDITVAHVDLHYAEGMGLIAQNSSDLYLEAFNVVVPTGSQRYFTTQADATHFSGCRGHIRSDNSRYEHMADDAINVHGTYLRVDSIAERGHVLFARFAHPQSFGFGWYQPNDTMALISRRDLTTLFTTVMTEVTSVVTPDGSDRYLSRIVLQEPLPDSLLNSNIPFAVENMSAYPSVTFDGNTVANNRARGALFSTRRLVKCTNNHFDHTHGSAILLCGDANGWYESGPCEHIIISDNTFTNALTGRYQFTNAVISIYPEMPQLPPTGTYYHGTVEITNNTFDQFPTPLYYLKSVEKLIYKANTHNPNQEFQSLYPDYKPSDFTVGEIIEK